MFRNCKNLGFPTYGWEDEVSKYLQNWVYNGCDMSAN
jgi:hypothetical protein